MSEKCRTASEVYNGVRYSGSKFFDELSLYEQQMWDRVARSEARMKVELADAQNRITALTGPIPLVPQSELDAANALLGAVASEISYTGDDAGLLQAVRNDRADCNRAGQSLAARHAADDVAKLQAELAEARSVPSLPAVDLPEDLTPELLSLAADVILAANPTVPIESAEFGVANELRLLRDRLEREQAKKAERDELLEEVADEVFSELSIHDVQRGPHTVELERVSLDVARRIALYFTVEAKAK